MLDDRGVSSFERSGRAERAACQTLACKLIHGSSE
jgi:hypothetical protein